MPADQRPTGAVWANYVSGEMTANERRVRLRELGTIDTDHRGLLSNARCLTEGVDVPTLDGVVFVDPKRSEVDIVQAVGRAIRLAPTTRPSAPSSSRSSSQQRGPRDHPGRLVVQDGLGGDQGAADARRGAGRTARLTAAGTGPRGGGRARLPEKIHLDLPARIDADFARAFDVRLVEQCHRALAGIGFGRLQDTYETTGLPLCQRITGPPKVVQSDIGPRHMCPRQGGKLSAERIEILGIR